MTSASHPRAPRATELRKGVVLGRHFERRGERIRCEQCPRYCTLSNGQRGFCFVRSAENDQIVLTSYGRASGFCIDPIEKKPLAHFFPGTSVLSFGTAGCNLGCRFCQNWSISTSEEMDRLGEPVSPEAVAEQAIAHGAASIAFTYNDPVIFAEYAIDTAYACRERGVHPVAVTAGYVTERARGELFRAMDATNIDLKGFSERFYRKLCLAHLAPVLETLEFVHRETDCWLEVTTLLIPGENDSDAELDALVHWFRDKLGPDVPLHFTAFHPDYKLLDRAATPAATLARARARAHAVGLRYVYTGNVTDVAGQSTTCPGCNATVVMRDGYRILDYRLDRMGACASCGARVAGHFADRPGRWGSKRLPIAISAP